MDRASQASREQQRAGFCGLRQDRDELVTAVAPDDVAGPHPAPQFAGDHGEHPVGMHVPATVVDELERVEVDERT